jgi:hypothetical protein
MRRLAAWAALTTSFALTGQADAGRILLDRVAVRFAAPDIGGTRSPRFIYERTLAFEARLEALADSQRTGSRHTGYRERHVRAALERHVAETLLASLRIDPEPTSAELARLTDAARGLLEQRVGGAHVITDAARAEGIEPREVLAMLRRQARASSYLDRMVAPMLAPSEAELRSVHRAGQTPFTGLTYAEAKGALRRWYVGFRLNQAVAAFFQNARSRVEIVVLDPQR